MPPGLLFTPPAAAVGGAAGVRLVASGHAGTAASSSSFLPGASKLLLASGVYRRGGSVTLPALATIADSNATPLTWTQIADVDQSLVSPTALRSTLWWARSPAAPVSMTVTITAVSTAGNVASVYELDNALQNFANIATGKSTAGDPAATLGTTPLSDSVLFAIGGVTLREDYGAVVPPNPFLDTPSGYTSLLNMTRQNGTAINPLSVQSAYLTPPAGVNNVAWISAGFISTAIILEVKRG